jgi:hypothetical protein
MLGQVIEKWSALPFEPLDSWGAYGHIVDRIVAQRYFLRVAALHPHTEETSLWTVACDSVAQWDRYPVGSWLLLQVSGWRFLAKLVRGAVILEPSEFR